LSVVGLISDTHGLIREEALRALHGVDLIIHAGDIGHESVIRALETMAPVHAVRGNVDVAPWARRFPDETTVEIGGRKLHVLHDRHGMTDDPVKAGLDVVVSGHSHRPSVETQNGVLYVNPGSAGPRRFTLPVTCGSLCLSGAGIDAAVTELISCEVGGTLRQWAGTTVPSS